MARQEARIKFMAQTFPTKAHTYTWNKLEEVKMVEFGYGALGVNKDCGPSTRVVVNSVPSEILEKPQKTTPSKPLPILIPY